MKKSSVSCFVLFVNLILSTRLTAAESTALVGDSADVVSYTLLGIGAAVTFGGMWALFNLYQSVIFAEKVRLLREYSPELLEKAGIEIQRESFFKKWYKKATNVVPVEKEHDIMLDHNYDGIRELDNSLPPWWLAIFYFTVAITPVYIWYNHYSDYAKSQNELYEIEVEKAEEAVKKYLAKQADQVDENTVIALNDAGEINLGKSMYDVNCAACHGQSGEGGLGPNLTDEYWLHGGGIKEVFTTIKYGVPEKGMISWKAQLRSSDMQKVASYILSLQGTEPPNAKEPQGDLWITENEAEESGALGMK